MHCTFKVKCLIKRYRSVSGCVLCALKVLCDETSAFKFYMFLECWFRGALHTWADGCPLKVKYLVNAEKLKLNLQSDPLIIDFFRSTDIS